MHGILLRCHDHPYSGRHGGFALFPVDETYFDSTIDFLIYVAM